MNIFTTSAIRPFLLVTTGFLALGLTACGAGSAASEKGWHESEAAVEAGLSPIVLLGDSVAAGEAAPLTQAVAASGAKFVDATSTGGGNVTGPNAEAQWKRLPKTLAKAEGGTVIYQVTTYDWGSESEQREAYERLAAETEKADADLVLVTMPPIRPDSFYKPHMSELARAAEVARSVAEEADGVEFLDAGEVWGDRYQRVRDGEIDRSKDGIHTCPQGAARFTAWLLDELAELEPAFEPAEASEWAETGWTSDKNFRGC